MSIFSGAYSDRPQAASVIVPLCNTEQFGISAGLEIAY